MTLFEAESLLERGSTAVPQSLTTQYFYGKFDLHGQPRSPYPAGHAILTVPYIWLARETFIRLPGVPQDGMVSLYIEAFGATLSSATFAAGAMAFFFLLLRRLALSVRDSLLLTTCVAFGTLLLPYSGYFFSEPLSALLLMSATYVLSDPEPSSSRTQALIAGIILGFGGWVRPTMLLAVGVFLLAIVLRGGVHRWKVAAMAALPPALSALGYLAWNKHLFGRAFDFGYPETAEFGKRLNTFQTPFYVGLTGFLVSPGKSVFLYSPLLILAIFGIRSLWKRDRGLATICAGLPITYLLLYMRYTQWEGGYCVGPRYLLPSITVSCMAVGAFLQSHARSPRYAIGMLGVLGFLVQLIISSTNFLEDQVIAAGQVGAGAYYDARFNYRLSYDPLITQGRRLLDYVSGRPAPLGFGFDRWFVFLHKLGINAGTIVIIAIVPLALAIWTFWALRRIWYAAEPGAGIAQPS